MSNPIKRLLDFFRENDSGQIEIVTKTVPVNRLFDSPIQKSRQPIKDRKRFDQLHARFAKTYFESVSFITKDDHNGCLKNLEEALQIAEELVAMEPLRGNPWMCKAQALGALHRLPEAIEACDHALEIDPSDPDKWELRGHILLLLGKQIEAESAFKKAKELSEKMH